MFILCLLVPPKIETEAKYKKPQNLKADSTLVLYVTVTGEPKPKVTWYHGETVLETTNGCTIETKDNSSRLSIKGTSAKNAGKYKVTAENEAGSDSMEFTVSVKGKKTTN